MRPRSLTVRGFRSYGAEHRFDFTGRNLVGVVGPIGSGKSSILDAIAFALFGRASSTSGNTRSLINQRVDTAHVELCFEIDGVEWRATRALRAKGQSGHQLRRLDGDGNVLEEVAGAKQTTGRVEELLGLDYEAFSRSVMLAQNQFARFLQAKPGERDDVLKRLFELERVEAMHAAARARLSGAARDLEELDRRREEVERDRDALAAVAEELRSAQDRLQTLERARPGLDRIASAVAIANEERASASRRITELERLAARMPSRGSTDELVSAAASDSEALRTAEAVRRQARLQVAAAEDAKARVVGELGDRAAHAAATRAVEEAKLAAQAMAAAEQAYEDSRRLTLSRRQQLADQTKSMAVSEGRVQGVDTAKKRAEDARDAARETLHAAEHASMASALREGLTSGSSCPVCHQHVARVPREEIPASLSEAKAALTASDNALRRLDRQHRQTVKLAAAAEADRSEARTAVATAEVAERQAMKGVTTARTYVEEATKVRRRLAGDGEAEQLIRRWAEALDRSERAKSEADGAAVRADEGLDRARLDRDSRQSELTSLAADLASAGAKLDVEVQPDTRPESLRAAVDRIAEAWEAAAADAETRRKEAARVLEDAEAARIEVLRELGLAGNADLVAEISAAREVVAALRSKAELLEERVTRLGELEKENATLLARRAIFERLTHDLVPSRFTRFLLDEERNDLAAVAGERLELLTGGRYRFSADGDFNILDLAAAETERTAKSLSGGETFLASLALALGLAEIVSRRGGQLDSFFLDEGFGSLDPEHLDLAMDGVERLSAGLPGGLVLVVSHVPEMRDRFEDLIVLDKDPVTGDARVVRS